MSDYPDVGDDSDTFDLEQTDRLLSTTRAVRRRLDLDRPVPRDVLLDCIRLAQQAPTASNTQTWHFVIVTDPAKRAELARLYNGVVARRAATRAAPADAHAERMFASTAYLSEVLHRVPVHVLPCIRRPLPDAPSPLDLASYYATIIPAAWSFMLALRSRGLGSVWTTQSVGAEQEVGALLGLPADVRHVALLPVAYTLGTRFSPASRPPPETITSWDSWSGE
ncbi:MAG TPA: nitroreductase family protein [Mycobacteriales bacterium]|jgi:nitroreductase|nr:nitroreductase family protein [Mycobacteriales bacterium]